MKIEEVLLIDRLLTAANIRFWVGGGWGIDALLGEHTRSHKDLDLFVSLSELTVMLPLLAAQGFALKMIWEENRWIDYPVTLPLITHVSGNDKVATAFVLKDTDNRELDFHIFTFDESGCCIPAWETDDAFFADAFAGCGTIAGVPVNCLSPGWQMHTHTGYTLQEKDRHDLRLLHERFFVAYPAEHMEVFSS